MNTSKLGLLATALCCTVAGAALAQSYHHDRDMRHDDRHDSRYSSSHQGWDRIGEVRVSERHDRDLQPVRLGGPIEGLRLDVENRSVRCRSVVANFGNGNDRMIFRGELEPGHPRMIDLPGDRRHVRSLAFDCSAPGRRDAIIHVSANVGRYRSDWQRNPDFNRVWSKMFNWGSNVINNWQLVDAVHFEGRGDHERSFTGWNGRRADAVALKPLNADARCSRVTAHFRNGWTKRLPLNRGDYLARGRFHEIDLPGRVSDLRRLDLNCRATDARQVTIQIFTSRG